MARDPGGHISSHSQRFGKGFFAEPAQGIMKKIGRRGAGASHGQTRQTATGFRPATQDPQAADEAGEKAYLRCKVREVLARIPEGRPQKVAALRETLQQGTYRIDSRKLSDLVPLGGFFLGDRREGLLGRDDLDLVPLLARYPSLIPEYLSLHRRNTRSWLEAVQDLLWVLEARDRYSGRHSARVTAIAVHFGRHLGLPAAELESLKTAGYLHDLGKVGVRDAILRKTGALTPRERASVEPHPLRGEKILKPWGLKPHEREIILHHHERWDGRGYPHGLAGEELSFPCRLLALADSFESLTSDRPYRQRASLPQALAIIQAHAGTQFDPDLAWNFISMIVSLARKDL